MIMELEGRSLECVTPRAVVGRSYVGQPRWAETAREAIEAIEASG